MEDRDSGVLFEWQTPTQIPYVPPETLDKKIEYLRRAGEFLLQTKFASSALIYAGKAMVDFANKKYNSMDKALNLTAPRGRPKPDLRHGKHFTLALRAMLLRLDGKTTVYVLEYVNNRYYDGIEPKRLYEIERDYREAVILFIAQKISERIARGDMGSK